MIDFFGTKVFFMIFDKKIEYKYGNQGDVHCFICVVVSLILLLCIHLKYM